MQTSRHTHTDIHTDIHPLTRRHVFFINSSLPDHCQSSANWRSRVDRCQGAVLCRLASEPQPLRFGRRCLWSPISTAQPRQGFAHKSIGGVAREPLLCSPTRDMDRRNQHPSSVGWEPHYRNFQMMLVVCMFVLMDACMYVCMYVCMCVCMCL